MESGSSVSRNNPHAFIHMETGAMKEAAQDKLASVTYSRCSGIALTKAHASLLRVLIGELQFKVAALVDPNFDSGDLKSKRGRKKDVDISIPVKRAKVNILPINELTWPELARRYILAVLSMDGNLDSPEITARESSKVFRCLQGDGGVLCGSLSGVAGMEADALVRSAFIPSWSFIIPTFSAVYLRIVVNELPSKQSYVISSRLHSSATFISRNTYLFNLVNCSSPFRMKKKK
ncbi:hypothetical protein C1H46_042113 [Malus baccata]|uniref:Uncharacterized protein n=1 Tax=Malus baccata TaxID=106549 RepID=A0A540KDS8_MALBA|nr:hypothetical protein C1H46_042113 [Malus baccata]